MGDSNPVPESHQFHAIRRTDYMLLFVDNLSITDITLTGLAFILFYLFLYISLIFWAHLKDRQVQVFTDKDLSTVSQIQEKSQAGSPGKSPNNRRANFRAINIDITSETLDFTTTQSIRTQEDLSGFFHCTSPDSKDINISSAYKLDMTSPMQRTGKPVKTNKVRTPNRESQVSFDKESGFPVAVNNTQGVDEDGTGRGTEVLNTKDEAGMNREDTPMPKEQRIPTDEFIYPAPAKQKQAAKQKVKPTINTNTRPISYTRETTRTKFSKLLSQRHVFISTVSRMSKISPRYKRVTLIYFLLSCNFFGMSFTYIDMSIFEGYKVFPLLKISIGSWVLFMLISWLSSVSKEGLKKAKTSEDFQNQLVNIEKEAKYKDIAVHVIVGVFTLLAVIQYGLFVSVKSNHVLSWCLYSIAVFIVQMLVYDALWLLVVAAMYVKAYDSRSMRKMYRQLNSLRFWKI